MKLYLSLQLCRANKYKLKKNWSRSSRMRQTWWRNWIRASKHQRCWRRNMIRRILNSRTISMNKKFLKSAKILSTIDWRVSLKISKKQRKLQRRFLRIKWRKLRMNSLRNKRFRSIWKERKQLKLKKRLFLSNNRNMRKSLLKTGKRSKN